MDFAKIGMEILKLHLESNNASNRDNHPSKNEFRHKLNVPYYNDHNKYHTYDVYLADESNRKHCCFLDIHGGSYIFGEHQDNYPYAYVLLKAGYDVVLLDYAPNDGTKDIYDLLYDVCENLRHVLDNVKEYDLFNDKFVLTGDSAGGHLALLLATAMQSDEVAETIGLVVPKFPLIATVLSCPVYDFANFTKGAPANGALERILGPKYLDREHLAKYSPRTYIHYHRLPIFDVTSNHDFLRSESQLLARDLMNKQNFKFIDYFTDNKEVSHVFNVGKIHLQESQEVNQAIVDFVDEILKKYK